MPQFQVGQSVRFHDGQHSIDAVVHEINADHLVIRADFEHDPEQYFTPAPKRILHLEGRGMRERERALIHCPSDTLFALYGTRIEPVPASPFTVGQRVRYSICSGSTCTGRITAIDDRVEVTLDEPLPYFLHDDDPRRYFTLDGSRGFSPASGSIEPLEEPEPMPTFSLNQRVRQTDTGVLGTVTDTSPYIEVRWDNGTNHHYLSDGSRCCGGPDMEPLPPPIEFKEGQRVRYTWGSAGRFADGVITLIDERIHVALDPTSDLGPGSRRFSLAGRNSAGSITPITDSRWVVGKRVRYHFGTSCLATILRVDERGVLIRCDDPECANMMEVERLMDMEGKNGGFYIEPLPDTPPEPKYNVGEAVMYETNSGDCATGVVTKTDDRYIYMKLDEDQTHFPSIEMERIFNLDGSGTGSLYSLPNMNCRVTDRGGSLTLAPPKWQPTKGREYPPEPKIVYGVWDSYYGRPLKEGNPTGYEPELGYAVLYEHESFRQTIYESEENVKTSGSLAQALSMWKNECYDIDLKAIENPLELMVGLKVYRAWFYADQFGGEFYLPNNLMGRRRISFAFMYPRVCCVPGLMLIEEVNEWIENHSGATVTAVDGTKVTMEHDGDSIEFHILPRLANEFRPEIVVTSVNSKGPLLQALAMRSIEQDSPQQLAA